MATDPCLLHIPVSQGKSRLLNFYLYVLISPLSARGHVLAQFGPSFACPLPSQGGSVEHLSWSTSWAHLHSCLHGPHSGPPSQLSHSASRASELSEITPAADAERSAVRQSSSVGAWLREDGNHTTQPTELFTGLWSQGNRTVNVAVDILQNRPRGPELQAEEKKNSVWLNRNLRRKFFVKSTVNWQGINVKRRESEWMAAKERNTS